MIKKNQDRAKIKKKLRELVAEASVNVEGQPNATFSGEYVDSEMSFDYYVKTDGEGKIVSKFALLK